MGTCCSVCWPDPAVLCDFPEVNQVRMCKCAMLVRAGVHEESGPQLAQRQGLKFKNGFRERYTVGKMLGKGQYSVVYLAENNDTGQLVAAKSIQKYSEALMSRQDYVDLVREISIMAKVRSLLPLRPRGWLPMSSRPHC